MRVSVTAVFPFSCLALLCVCVRVCVFACACVCGTKFKDKKARKVLVGAAKAAISKANLGKDQELSVDSVVGVVGVSVVRNEGRRLVGLRLPPDQKHAQEFPSDIMTDLNNI